MADAVVDLQATNIFGLNANFNTSGSTTTPTKTRTEVLDESGNVACARLVGDIEEVTQSGIMYCGTDFVGDLATFLTTFGDVQNDWLVTAINISMTAGAPATMDITGHNHVTNAHVTGVSIGQADVSDFLPHEVTEAFAAWDGNNVPDFGITLGTTATPSSATVGFAMNHVDTPDTNGDHFVGKNTTPRCTLSMDFSGIPTSSTAAALEVDLKANTNNMLDPLVMPVALSDSNTAHDTSSFTCEANADLITA